MAVPYPSTLPAPQYRGKQDLPTQTYYHTPMDYASKKRPKSTGQYFINVTFLYNSLEMSIFNEWYIIQLNNGVSTFEASWDVAGLRTLFEFTFTEGGQPSISRVATSYEVKCRLELKSDIFELLSQNNLNGFCPDIIDCQDSLINFAKNYIAS